MPTAAEINRADINKRCKLLRMKSSIAPGPELFGRLTKARPDRSGAKMARLNPALAALLAGLVWLSLSAATVYGSVLHAQSSANEVSTKRTERSFPSIDRQAVKLQNDTIASIKILLAGKRTTEALQVSEKALGQFPANVQLRFLYGVALTDSGDTDQAIDLFSELTQEHPELAEPYNNLAVLHASTGNLAAARDALELAVVAVPDYPLAFENLGDVYTRLAVQAYRQGAAVKTANATIRRKLVLARALLEKISQTPSRPR